MIFMEIFIEKLNYLGIDFIKKVATIYNFPQNFSNPISN